MRYCSRLSGFQVREWAENLQNIALIRVLFPPGVHAFGIVRGCAFLPIITRTNYIENIYIVQIFCLWVHLTRKRWQGRFLDVLMLPLKHDSATLLMKNLINAILRAQLSMRWILNYSIWRWRLDSNLYVISPTVLNGTFVLMEANCAPNSESFYYLTKPFVASAVAVVDTWDESFLVELIWHLCAFFVWIFWIASPIWIFPPWCNSDICSSSSSVRLRSCYLLCILTL